jgi:beta-phosphoglucomutase
MPLQAIVFDFDGVIADTEPIHLRGFQEELVAHGYSLSERDYLDRYLGVSDREGFEAVSRDQGRPLDATVIDLMIARKSARVQALAASPSPVFPGVPERVREWSLAVPVAIASGALRVEIEAILNGAALRSCFGTIVSADDPVVGKPSPAPYLLALEQLATATGRTAAFDPGYCVALEDSRWGIESAKRAGLRVVGVASSYPASALGEADLVVSTVADLTLGALRALVDCPDTGPRPVSARVP